MKKDNKGIFKNLALISQIGISVVTPIFLTMAIGRLLDKWFGTEGIFIMIGLILGVGAGFLNLLRMTGILNSKRK